MFVCYQMYIGDAVIGHVNTLGREVIQDMPKKEIQVWDEMMVP